MWDSDLGAGWIASRVRTIIRRQLHRPLPSGWGYQWKLPCDDCQCIKVMKTAGDLFFKWKQLSMFFSIVVKSWWIIRTDAFYKTTQKLSCFIKCILPFKFRWLLMVSVLMVLHMNQSFALNRWCWIALLVLLYCLHRSDWPDEIERYPAGQILFLCSRKANLSKS